MIFNEKLGFPVIGISRTSGAMPKKHCQQVLGPNDCTFSNCNANCVKQYLGIGYCVGPYPHKCVCVYNCPH